MEEKRMREISDEELENVSGGGCSQYTSYVIDGKRYKVIPNNGDVNGCSSFVCRWCGGGKGKHLAGVNSNTVVARIKMPTIAADANIFMVAIARNFIKTHKKQTER